MYTAHLSIFVLTIDENGTLFTRNQHNAGYFILDSEWVEKYKALHKQKTGEELDNQVALEHFNKLITLVRKTYRPIPTRDKELFEQLSK